MSFGKGSNTSTTNTAPNSAAMSTYQQLLQRAQQTSEKPYQAFTGEQVAPVNQQQGAGIGTINNYAGAAQPNISQASGMLSAAGTPINANDINQYMDPYTNQVIGATQADFDTQNQRANSTVLGNAASASALGGDRAGVAQALTQEAQNRVQAPVIAGLRSQGYQKAVNTAENEKLREAQAASGLANVGVAGQQAGIAGGSAQVGAGTLQQQTQQSQDTANFQEYLRSQGYDFQTAQWLSGIATGVGSQMGGTGQTQGPTPNPWSQVAGLGLAAASFVKDGGAVPKGYASGGSPFLADATYIPTVSGLTAGHGAPQAPSLPGQQGQNASQTSAMGKGIAALGKKAMGLGSDDGTSDYAYAPPVAGTGDFTPNYMPGYGYYGVASKNGGGIRGYATRGAVDDPPPLAGFGMGSVAPDSFGERFPRNDMEDLNPGNIDTAKYLHGVGTVRRNEEFVDNGRDLGEPTQTPRLPEERPTSVAGVGSSYPAEFGKLDDTGEGSLAYAPRSRTAPPTAGLARLPASALGSAPTPSADSGEDKTGLLKMFNMSPELRQGMLMAGLGMMAAPRGGPGSFLANVGIGGTQGVGAYNSAVNASAERDAAARKEAFDKAKFDRPYSEMTMAEKLAEKRANVNEVYRRQTDARAAAREDRAAKSQELLLDPTSGLDPKVKDAMAAGVHGQEFLNVLDPVERNLVESVGNYETSPYSAFSKLKGTAERKMALIKQFNPDYDDSWYKNKASTLKNFYGNTAPNSPVVLARNANTAIGHAGDIAEAVQTLQTANPGLLQAAKNSGTPILSYLASQAQNRLYVGTPTGEALNNIKAILPLYAGETTRFYAGGEGSETMRAAVTAPLNPNLSAAELLGALRTQAHLFKSKTEPMEQEFRDALDAPGLKEYGTKKQMREWHVVKAHAQKAFDRIEQLYGEAHASKIGATGTIPEGSIPGMKGGQKVWKTPDGKFIPRN